MGKDLTHFDRSGRPVMIDVSAKPTTSRRAVAEGRVLMSAETLDLVVSRSGSKGDVLATAELAGITGAKQTANLVPLCHPLPLASVKLRIEPDHDLPGLTVRAETITIGQTGVEMEAMTAICVACLTIYDMLKSVERGMRIEQIRLLEKSGGQSGKWQNST